MKTVLNLSRSASNRPIVEHLDAQTIQSSLFANQLSDALTMLNKYLAANLDKKKETFHEKFVDSVTDADNNILAFIGERGTGKTSCMLTMSSLLLEDERREKLYNYEQVRLCPFFHVGMIDPAFFDQEHNVLSIFLAKMYQTYQLWLQNEDEATIDQDAQSRLMESFCDAQRHLNFMLDRPSNVHDDLERLLVFSAATDLKKDIHKLVEYYKELRKYPKGSKLLLMIDDIDLNMVEGSRMAELIRKYFVQPNIVVLISVKLGQLGMVKKQEFVDAYHSVLEEDLLKIDTIEEMAERYLAKFVPQSHRIFMPAPETLYHLPAKVSAFESDPRNNMPCMTLVCSEIFQKSRYLFYNSPYNVSSIVPNNLRELNQLVTMLNHLPYYKDENGEHEYNKSLFVQYFTTDWVANHICLDHQELVKEILKEDQFSRLNNKVVKILKKQYEAILKQGEQNPEITYILDDANLVYNISVGDVLAVINYLSTRCVTEYDQQFFFFLRSLYSIRLYEAYDLMTDVLDHDDKADAKRFVLAEDEYQHLSEYDKLVGGTLINSRVMPPLSVTDKAGKEVNLSLRLVHSSSLQNLYEECSAKWNDAFEKGNAQLLELMVLSIYRDAYSETASAELGNFKNYRKQPIIAFDKIRESGLYVFDLGALMFNVTRVEDCYKRFSFGEALWREAQKNKKSLWSKFVSNIPADKGPYTEHVWKSYSCIRNVEILEKFVNHIRQEISIVGKRLEANEEYLALYGLYFESASSFTINSYGFEPNSNDRYSIQFKFYDVIAQLFKNKDWGDQWGNWFMKMFYEKEASTASDSPSSNDSKPVSGSD